MPPSIIVDIGELHQLYLLLSLAWLREQAVLLVSCSNLRGLLALMITAAGVSEQLLHSETALWALPLR